MKDKFQTLTSTCIPIPRENIDTDQIIPARFLKATSRKGFGDNLFRDWRYDNEGNKIDSFILNNPKYSGTILVAGKNFGSGSSREHAAWAVAGSGFKVVISSFFADIFKNNALNNCLLPVVVSDKFLSDLFSSINANPGTTVTVNLIEQTVTNNALGQTEHFDISPYKKDCLLNGFDDIDFLLNNLNDIENWEKTRPSIY